ncbi:MAG: alpha/beta hydrolase [Flavobacteriales bacterium]|nr:alpha/beta hydrolase [Flavobacteriales bacterium]
MQMNHMMVHYRDEGEGKVILLIHGTFASLHTYDKWTKSLKKKYRVIRMDLPGFGLTGPTRNGKYTINTYIRFLTKFLDNLDVKKCHIAGSSLGGWLAWEFSAKYPKRVDRLILIGSAGYFIDQRLPLPFLMAQTPLLRRFMKHITPKTLVARFVKEVFGNPEKVTDELIDRYYDMLTRRGNRDAFIALANTKFVMHVEKVRKIKALTLIMWGGNDSWVSVKNAEAFEKDLPRSKTVIYEGVGHIPMEEIPGKSVRDLHKFLLNGKTA